MDQNLLHFRIICPTIGQRFSTSKVVSATMVGTAKRKKYAFKIGWSLPYISMYPTLIAGQNSKRTSIIQIYYFCAFSTSKNVVIIFRKFWKTGTHTIWNDTLSLVSDYFFFSYFRKLILSLLIHIQCNKGESPRFGLKKK